METIKLSLFAGLWLRKRDAIKHLLWSPNQLTNVHRSFETFQKSLSDKR